MRKILFIAMFLFTVNTLMYSQNIASCDIAEPFCTGVTYAFPMATNTSAEVGPNYGCLYSQPNPYWYFARVGYQGDIIIQINSPTGNDVDFAAWGPFSNPVFPCANQLTASCSSCPNNTDSIASYPYGNLVDCSYDPAPNETVHISNALVGEFYLIMITNYSNSPGNLEFSQSNVSGTPGVDFGTTDCSFLLNQYLNGTVYFDQNVNNVMDSNEVGVGGAIVYINGCFGAMTQSDGTYAIYNCDSADIINISLPANMTASSITPQQQPLIAGQSVYDFAVVLDTTPDLSVSLTHYGAPGVNFNSNYLITVSNNCGSVLSGSCEFVLDSGLTFISSTYPCTSVNGQTYTWDFTGLNPLSSIINNITVLSDSMLLDSTLIVSTAYVSTGSGEVNLTNNADEASYYILTSYDPNFIENSPTDTLNQLFVNNSEFIEYTIHFQNTGSAAANKVRVFNPASTYLIKPSFELVCSSHQCDVIYNPDGSFVFLFNEINLPAASVNEAGSHGFVTYRMRCNPNLQINDVINNTAEIYFDFNAPITTNTTENYLVGTHVNVRNNVNDVLSVYPVPSGDYVNIELPVSGERAKLSISTPGGQVVYEGYYSGSKAVVNVSEYEKGLYIIKLSTGDKVLFGKMVVN